MTVTLAPPTVTATRLPDTPYVGLVPYGEDDAAFFFGREEEKQIVAGNLRASRLTIVYGPSGVGKTSLLQAGVVRDLHERVLATAATQPERAPFAVCVVREWRADPLVTMVDAIRAAAVEALGRELPAPEAGEPLVEVLRSWTQAVRTILVVLDQFEDYFLYHPDEDGDGTFAAEFPRIVNEPNLRVNFLLSLREDAWAKLDHFEGRIPALFGNYVRVQHLDRRTGRQAIEEPVVEWNRRMPPDDPPFTIESDLTGAVLDAAAGGALAPHAGGVGGDLDGASADAVEAPFLQLVMDRLWRATVEAGSRRLDLARLQELGGAERIVENHLREALTALTPAEKEMTAELFRFLVTRSKTKIAHSSSDLAEWTKRPEPEVTAVLDKLCRGESGRILRAVSPTGPEEAERYELFHDVLAEPVLEWRRGYEQRRDRRRTVKRSAQIVGGLLVLVVLFAALGIWALQRKADADKEAARAEAARREATTLALASSAAALRDNHLDVALLLGLEANRGPQRAEARSAMVSALQAARRSGLDAVIHAQEVVRSVALSRDGNTLAAADGETVRLWDLHGHKSLGELSLGGPVANVTLSPDGGTLAAALDSGIVQLFEVGTRVPLTDPLPNRAAIAALGADLGRLATISSETARRRTRVNADRSALVSVAYSPDGRSYAAADEFGDARVLAARTGGTIDRLHGVRQVAFGAGGRTLVTAGTGGKIRVRDRRTHRDLAEPVRTDANAATSLAFGGGTLAVGADGMIRVWNVRGRPALGEPLLRGRGLTRSVTFSTDGRRIAAADGASVRLFDARTHKPVATLGDHSGTTMRYTRATATPGGGRFGTTIRSVAIAPDGGAVAAAGGPRVMLWDVASRKGEPLSGAKSRCQGKSHEISGVLVICELKTVSFSADGSLLAAAGNGKDIRLWDVRSRAPLGTLSGHRQLVSSLAFAPHGSMLASGSYEGKVRLWDARARREVRRPIAMPRNEPILDVALSGSGILAAAAANGTVFLWDVGSGQERGRLSGHTGWVFGVAFSPDGRTVVSTGIDGTIRLWDVRTRRPLGQPLRANRSPVESPAISPDGGTLATASLFDGVQLWEGILWSHWPELRDRVCDFVLGAPIAREWDEYASDVKPPANCPG